MKLLNVERKRSRVMMTRKVAGIKLKRTLGRIGGRCRWVAVLASRTVSFDAAGGAWSSYLHPKGGENSYVLSAQTLRQCVIDTQLEMHKRLRAEKRAVKFAGGMFQ